MQYDREGMYPQHPCKGCGRLLNADGGHPAELYAGTYTGLCYRCQNGAAFVEQVSKLDNAQFISYPPTCPSWRRDREVRIAYADCLDCRGKGRLREGDDYKGCATCSERYSRHPVRQWAEQLRRKVYDEAQAEFDKRLLAAGIPPNPKKATKKKQAPLTEEQQAKAKAIGELIYTEVYRPRLQAAELEIAERMLEAEPTEQAA